MRHNEDVLNGELSKKLPWAVGTAELDSPHAKAHLLLQVLIGGVFCIFLYLSLANLVSGKEMNTHLYNRIHAYMHVSRLCCV